MIVYDSTVSERYARALFNVMKRQGTLESGKNDAEQLLLLNIKGSKMHVYLRSPQFSTERKLALIETAFAGKAEPKILQMLQMLIKKGRIEYSRPVFTRFVELAEADQGFRQAEVATASDLDGEQKNKLQQVLEKYTGAHLRLKFRVEPELIGGVRFTMGDLLIDDTVKGKLERLKFQLQEAARA